MARGRAGEKEEKTVLNSNSLITISSTVLNSFL